MIINFHIFEDKLTEPQVGDYALVRPEKNDLDISLSIGKIEDITTDCKHKFPYTIVFKMGIRQNFSRDDITHWSKNKNTIKEALKQCLKEMQFDL